MRGMAAAGAQAITAARSAPETTDLPARFIAADLASAKRIETFPESVNRIRERLDILIHNLGGFNSLGGGFTPLTDERWLEELNLNLLARRATESCLGSSIAGSLFMAPARGAGFPCQIHANERGTGSGIPMGSPRSIRFPGEPPTVRTHRRAFGGSAGRNVEDDVLSVPPPIGDQTYAIREFHQTIGARLCVGLDNHGSSWKRMAVGEDEPHFHSYSISAASTTRLGRTLPCDGGSLLVAPPSPVQE